MHIQMTKNKGCCQSAIRFTSSSLKATTIADRKGDLQSRIMSTIEPLTVNLLIIMFPNRALSHLADETRYKHKLIPIALDVYNETHSDSC